MIVRVRSALLHIRSTLLERDTTLQNKMQSAINNIAEPTSGEGGKRSKTLRIDSAPPPAFPYPDGKVKRISLPEDPYINKFFQKHPDPKHEDAVKICSFEPPLARVFGLRVLGLEEPGISEEEAMAVADMEYQAERKAKKAAYARLKQIAPLQGKKPPPNLYPSAFKQIQAKEKKYVHKRFFGDKSLETLQTLKEQKMAEFQDRNVVSSTGGRGPCRFLAIHSVVDQLV